MFGRLANIESIETSENNATTFYAPPAAIPMVASVHKKIREKLAIRLAKPEE